MQEIIAIEQVADLVEDTSETLAPEDTLFGKVLRHLGKELLFVVAK